MGSAESTAYNIFPDGLGTELEHGILVLENGQHILSDILTNKIDTLVPEELQGFNTYLLNGSRIYNDGPAGLETGTPECSNPVDAVAYDRVNEIVVAQMIANFFDLLPREKREQIVVRHQKRVVDSNGNRKGLHDNIGYERGTAISYEASHYPPSLSTYAAARQFMTGAGLAIGGIAKFSQKVDGLAAVYGYGYQGYMLRFTPEEGGNRIEFRNGDANISDWAAIMRLGSAALIAALNQLPTTHKIINNHPLVSSNPLPHAKNTNSFYFDYDGNFDIHPELMESVSFMRTIGELTLGIVAETEELPDIYRAIAEELIDYCDDFEAVARGDADFSSLADRADWAAKFHVIREHYDRRTEDWNKEVSPLHAPIAAALDMAYDVLQYKQDHNGNVSVTKRGFGYGLRERGNFTYSIPTDKITRGLQLPPLDMRAQLRSHIMQEYEVEGISWSSARVRIGGQVLQITMPRVSSPHFQKYDAKRIAALRKF